jgi:hypothetical protein
MHPFEGRVFGRIVSDASGQRLAGVQASMPDDGKTAMTDSTGWFEIVGVPIGRRQLRVSSCPAAQGIVEVTDEFTDTLEVRVPCKGR